MLRRKRDKLSMPCTRIQFVPAERSGQHTSAYLDLVYDALRPFLMYIYGNEATGKTVLEQLYSRGFSEFSPPFGQLAIDETSGELMGLAAWLTGQELHRERLRGAVALAGLEVFRRNKDYALRLRAAAKTLFPVAESDYYLACIAVTPGWRRRGVATQLLDFGKGAAQRLGLKRLVLEVDPAAVPAVACYRRLGYQIVGRVAADDSPTAAHLENLHMACRLDAAT
jgi:ribosomal protein S18 acetylase RimI-like enzyme